MTLSAKVSGTWQTITDPQAKVSGTWRPMQNVYAKVAGVWQMIYSRFTPVTHLWTPVNFPSHPPGDQENVPENATHLRITCQGAGGAGGASFGGGGGGYVVKDITISPSDWPSGSARFLTMWGGGGYATGGDAGAFEGGGTARISGTLAIGAIDITGSGGAFAGAGGAATGGDTNTPGGAGSNTGSGVGVAGGGGPAGNGGARDLDSDGFGSGGSDGYWKFEWT